MILWSVDVFSQASKLSRRLCQVSTQEAQNKLNLGLISDAGLFPHLFHLYICKLHYGPPVSLCIYSWKIFKLKEVLYGSIFHSYHHQLSPILWGFSRREEAKTPLLFPIAIKNLHHKNTYWITALVLWKRIQWNRNVTVGLGKGEFKKWKSGLE